MKIVILFEVQSRRFEKKKLSAFYAALTNDLMLQCIIY